jgi:levanase
MLGEESGDTPVGILTSPALTPGKRSWLEFRVGGGDAIGILSQSGVRLMVDGRVWGAYSGRRSEYLRHHRVDLSPLAGKTIRVEIFDESTIKWGHVIADRFALHHIK